MRYLILLITLHTLLYGAKDLLKSDYHDNILKEYKKYQISSLIEKKYIPYNYWLFTDYNPKNININEQLSAPQRRLAESFLYTQAFMISTVLVLWVMPESVSKWDKNALEEKSLSERWKEHVKAGPVWDHDDFVINYIGHPVSGAYYYTAARGCGISPGGSFLYSAFLSTFVWEYGYEAFAEIPSIQDIFSTPVIGSLMGEGFYILEKKIDKNGGEVLGSKTLGNIGYFLLNPIGSLSTGLSDFFNIHAVFRFQAYQPYHMMEQQKRYLFENRPIVASQQNYGFVLEIQY